MATPSEAGSQTVKITDLSVPQLSQLKKQLDDELQTLTSSFQSLRAAQSKFRDCLSSLSKGLASKNGAREILVPLTNSLYVPGTLADTERVIVDVGTGFFVEKSKDEARVFYDGKVAELGKSLKELEAIVQGKSETLRAIEDALRVKILQGQGQQGSSASATAAVGA